jgi:hypothetical protein
MVAFLAVFFSVAAVNDALLSGRVTRTGLGGPGIWVFGCVNI